MEAIVTRYYSPLARSGLSLALIVITTLALMPATAISLPSWNDKLQHFLAFFALSYLLDASFPRKSFNWRKGLLLLSYGILLECLQGFTDYREASLADVLADLVGIFGYALSIPMLKKIPLVNWRWSLTEASYDRSD